MLKRTYDEQDCSIARALEAVGERWTLLIIRDLMIGFRRFDDLAARLAISTNVLASRLERLIDLGLVARHPYNERPPRVEYRLTDKGDDLWPVLHGLGIWGDLYLAGGKPPVRLSHRDCGGQVDRNRRCTACGADVTGRNVLFTPATPPKAGRTIGARVQS